jgi:hypothetical protein
MRLKLALLALGAGLVALPASAQQSYRDTRDCRSVQRGNQAAGVVVGGIIGGLLGSHVAARGHRGDGTAVGAAVGALAGSAVGAGRPGDCQPAYYDPEPPPPSRYGYSPAYRNDPRDTDAYGRYGHPRDDDRYSQDYRYAPEDDRYRYSDDLAHSDRDGGRLDDQDYADYNRSKNDISECRTVDSTTRLPDGSRVTRQSEACRSAEFGEWTLKD